MNTARLVWELQTTDGQARSGTKVVSIIAVVSYVVSSTIAFIVAGGTWMFYWRWKDGILTGVPQIDKAEMLYIWFIFALFACLFIGPALFRLTAQAAIVGVSGRDRRLATLRLIGLSSRDITHMTILETGAQALTGILLGGALSILLLPLFCNLSFQNKRVEFSEILLPWWGYAGLGAILFVMALCSAFVGIHRVRITPLGVARRQMPAVLKRWRLVLFIAVFIITVIVMNHLSISSGMVPALVIVTTLVVFFSVLNVASPYIMQIIAKLASRLPGTAHFVACCRIATNARVAWRRSSAIAFFGLLTGFLVTTPLGADGLSALLDKDPNAGLLFADISTGELLTLIFGFTITSMSLFLGQASEVFENASLTRSLQLIGVKRSFHTKVALVEIMLPIVVASLFGFIIGSTIATVMLAGGAGAATNINFASRLAFALSILGSGWLVTVSALLLTEPLRTRVLEQKIRRND